MGISFTGWLSQVSEDLTESHSRTWALSRGLYYTYLGLWHTATSRYPLGTNVFDREWDALIVLDACRVDALRAVSDEYDFLGDVESVWSVGSTSHEWAAKTFTSTYADEISGTAYVTGNGYLYRTAADGKYPPSGGTAPLGWPNWDLVSLSDFQHVDNVWRDSRIEEIRTVPPRRMTDRAIRAGREHDPDRLVVHYMQPHTPYIGNAVDDGEVDPDAVEHVRPLGAMRRGELDADVAWDRYLDNLRLALDEVETLLANLDAERVVVSADHGELFGEFGEYGHPDGWPLAAVRTVPWAATTATDTGARAPTVEPTDADTDVTELLEGLGYVT